MVAAWVVAAGVLAGRLPAGAGGVEAFCEAFASAMEVGRRRPRRPWPCGESEADAPAVCGLLMMRRLTDTLMPSRAHVRSNAPSGRRLRFAVAIRRSRPKRPGSLSSSTVRPSKVVADTRAPGAPCGFGQTKLAHCGGVLR